MKLKEKFREREKKNWVEILLSSCSLVNVQVKGMGENDENFQSIFWLGFFLLKKKLKLQLQREFKIRDFYLLGSYPLVGRHVVNGSKVGCYVVNELEVS